LPGGTYILYVDTPLEVLALVPGQLGVAEPGVKLVGLHGGSSEDLPGVGVDLAAVDQAEVGARCRFVVVEAAEVDHAETQAATARFRFCMVWPASSSA